MYVIDMMRSRVNIFLMLVMMGSLLGYQSAEASCSVTVTDLNFGEISPVSLQLYQVDTSSKLTYRCSSLVSQQSQVYVCIEIDEAQGSGFESRMLSHTVLSSNKLFFNVFKNPARTQIWGNQYNADNSPLVIDYGNLTLDLSSVISGTVDIYGRLFTSEQSMFKNIGLYTATMNIRVRILLTDFIGLTSCSQSEQLGNSVLNAQANLVSECMVNTTTLDFGVQPSNFSGPINATSEINTHCSNGTPYQISLNNGLHADGSTRRMRSASGDFISYELYNNASRTQRWGETLNTSETVQKVSTGSPEGSTVYGQVMPAVGLRATTYQDTVTVTITY